VIYVAADIFYVRGNETTPFCVPGDSGSLVLNGDGVLLGVVTQIDFKEISNRSTYATAVLPV
jgi:hypothetical protein